MYILELSRGFPSEKYPLNGIFEFDQAKALASRGNKVVLIAIDLRSIRRFRKYGLHILRKSEVTVYNFNFPLGRLPSRLLSFFSYFFLQLVYNRVLINEGKPDLLHAHFCFPQGYAAARLKQKTNIPLVITEHCSDLMQSYMSKGKKIYYAYGYKNADCIISVSNALHDEIKKKFDFNSIVVFNIVDLSIFKYKEKKEEKRFKIITIANCNIRKGLDILIKSFANIRNKNSHLSIIGDGPELNNLKQLAIDLNVASRIDFLGYKDRCEIVTCLQNSDLFVLSSRFETFGVVYIEALATGTPIIATKCGGPTDIVTNENGLLVEVDNKNELVRAIDSMIENYKKYKLYNISETTQKKYSPEIIGLQLENVFISTLNEYQKGVCK